MYYNYVVGALSLEMLFRRYADSHDERAARELVARTRQRLLAIARRIGNPSDAEDSVQTAYLSLLHKRDSEFGAPVFPWLVTATVRIAYRAKAKRQRMVEIASRLVRPPEPDIPAMRVGEADERRLLRDRVADLPASLRDPVVLHYFHCLSVEQTGALLGLSRDAVKKRLQRARAVLRSNLGPRLGFWLLAVPWRCADAAATIAGGVVMKKAMMTATVLFVLAIVTIAIVVRSGNRLTDEPRPRSVMISRQVRDAPPPQDGAQADAVVSEVAEEYSGVVLAPNETPVEGATVRIGAYYWINGHRIARPVPTQEASRTGPQGRFRIDPRSGLNPRSWDKIAAVEYHAWAEGFAWTAARCALDERTTIVLREGGSLLVAVRRTDGSPVGRAFLLLQRPTKTGFEDFLSGTGADVRFDVVPGTYQLAVSATDLAPCLETGITVAADETKTVTVTLATGVAYRIEVVDSHGRAIENAKVSARGPGRSRGFAKTDRSGRCRIGGIAIPHSIGETAADVRFDVKADGFAPYSESVRVPDTEGEEEIRLELRRGARVELRFRGPDGKPLVEQNIYIFYAPSEPPSLGDSVGRTTDTAGKILFPALERGSIMVQILGIDNRPRRFKLTGKPQTITIDLSPGDHEVVGHVFGPGGGPLTDGVVGFVPAAQRKEGPRDTDRVPVGDDGTFRVKGLEAGEGELWVWAPGFAAQSASVSVPLREVEVRLREGRRVAGVVVARKGVPVADVPVRLERYFFDRWVEMGVVRTGTNGAFAFRGIGDEAAKLQLRIPQGEQWIESHGFGCAVRPGDVNVRMTVKPTTEGYGLKIPILIADKTGTVPHGRLSVIYSRDGKRGGDVLTQATGTPGRFILRYVDAPGTCDFRFSIPGYLPAALSGVVISDKAEQPTLRPVFDRGAILVVHARFADGSPVANTSLLCDDRSARTDAHGRVEFGGFEPGRGRIEVYKLGDYFLHSGSVEVEAPGEVEIVLARRGVVIGRSTAKGPFRWRLVDANDVVQDTRETDRNRVRLFTTVTGPHRLVVTSAERAHEHHIEVRIGDSIAAGSK